MARLHSTSPSPRRICSYSQYGLKFTALTMQTQEVFPKQRDQFTDSQRAKRGHTFQSTDQPNPHTVVLRKGSQGPKQTSFSVLIMVRKCSVSFFLLLNPPSFSSLEIISIQQAFLCFSDILLRTVAKLYGCVCECSLAHVLQTAASEKGIFELLETIYYTASYPAHSGRDFNISPCLSARDSGEEEMHRDHYSYKLSEWFIKDSRRRHKQLYQTVSTLSTQVQYFALLGMCRSSFRNS